MDWRLAESALRRGDGRLGDLAWGLLMVALGLLLGIGKALVEDHERRRAPDRTVERLRPR